MKTKITQIASCVLLWLSSGQAQTQVPCSNDLNGFVSYKNVAGTGTYQLKKGFEEKASQTYYYSGPGRISGVRLYGNNPVPGGVPLKIGVYNVDVNNRPTAEITSVNYTWFNFSNSNGFVDVTFPGGVLVNNKFAISVEIRNVRPFGEIFNLVYTGNGEGGGQDLASIAGTSTAFNWVSAKNDFSKDGDFYLIPEMANLNIPGFKTTSSCYEINSVVSFSNTSQMTKDSMFNKIAFANYSGSNKFYKWNFGDGSPISNVINPAHTYTAGGVYTVSLTTTIEGWENTCIKTFTRSVSVGLAVTSLSITNVTCADGHDGSFVASGQFGAPSYSYSLNGDIVLKNSNTTMSIGWQTSPNFNNLYAGNYVLHIMDSIGCTSSSTLTITQPAPILFDQVLVTNSSCGNSTGAITATATGGVGSLQYNINNGVFQSTGTFTNIMSGTYTLTVKDVNSCVTSSVIVVNDLGGPILNTPNTTNVSCFGGSDGSITLSSTGGTGLIQYSINGGSTFQTSGVFSNVSAGTYIVVVKDNATCMDIAIVVISQGSSLLLTASSIPVICNGESNGQINVVSSGGTGSHSYSINGIDYQSGTNFSGLAAGNYTVYAKDITSCIMTKTVSVTEPPVISILLTSTSVTCNNFSNGSIVAGASGGNGDYSYSIDGINFQTVGTFLNFPAGLYTITVKDSANCINSSTISISQPSPITATVNTTNSTCSFTNGSIMAIAGGGSGSGYEYSIDGGINFFSSGLFSPLPASTQFIIIRDDSGCQIVVSGTILDSDGPVIISSSQQNVSCFDGNDGTITINTVSGGSGLLEYSKNGINYQTSPVFSGLEAGVYVIQVKDANGCTGSITKTITQPNAFLISVNSASISCFGTGIGSATITASGGAGLLSYSINGSTYQSSTIFNSLMAGSYTVNVKDAANCMGSANFSILEASQIQIVLGVLNVTCNGADNGVITAKVSGGQAPYLYSINGIDYFLSNSFGSLVGGTTYTVYVKDVNNCTVSTTQLVSEPAVINIVPIINNIKCANGNNGSISLNVSGGVSPYTYKWSNNSTAQSISNLTAGVYSVTITDFKGCISTRSYTLTQPSNPIIVNEFISPASTISSLDGAIDISVNGGVSPYDYNWSNGAITEDVSGLSTGSYTVTITDANVCVKSFTFNVGVSTGLVNMQITDGEIKVYPNPANDYTVVEVLGFKIDKIEIMNLLGQKVLVNEINNSVAKINTADLLNGTYFIKIYFNNSTVTKKINIIK